MNILIAPDSFKESLSATQVAAAIAEGIRQCDPKCDIVELPFSDGGEGAFEVLETLGLGAPVMCKTFDPLGRPLEAPYFKFSDQKNAWIELSQASGLALLKTEEQNPLFTSTFGTGIQIKAALDAGCTQLILGVGGSATHDIATGIFTALGGRILDSTGKELKACGKALENCTSLDFNTLDERLKKVKITIACDVTNPLTGPNGATNVYASQKGATPQIIETLEKATLHFAKILHRETGKNYTGLLGGGAAGGTSAGMMAYTNATLEPGFDLLQHYADLEEKIKQADLIITGEGRTDLQSTYGKLPFKIARLAQKYKKPTLLYAGSITASSEALEEAGIIAAYAIKTPPMTLEYAKENAYELLVDKTRKTLKNWI